MQAMIDRIPRRNKQAWRACVVTAMVMVGEYLPTTRTLNGERHGLLQVMLWLSLAIN
jgi:hypothetical protein